MISAEHDVRSWSTERLQRRQVRWHQSHGVSSPTGYRYLATARTQLRCWYRSDEDGDEGRTQRRLADCSEEADGGFDQVEGSNADELEHRRPEPVQDTEESAVHEVAD